MYSTIPLLFYFFVKILLYHTDKTVTDCSTIFNFVCFLFYNQLNKLGIGFRFFILLQSTTICLKLNTSID